MYRLFIFIAFIWLPWFLVMFWQIMTVIYHWQIKEYRFDRMISWLKESGLLSWRNLITTGLKILAAVWVLLIFRLPTISWLYIVIPVIYVYYIYLALEFVRFVLTNEVVRPGFSIRNLLLVFLAGVAMVAPFVYVLNFGFQIIHETPLSVITENPRTFNVASFLPSEDANIAVFPIETVVLVMSAVAWLCLDILMPPLITLFVGLTEPFALLRRNILINKAKQKIQEMSDLKVVGITGSYGKSSTKDMLYEILRDDYKVVKSPNNYNTHLGAAETVVRRLKSDTQILVQEMGAYKKGEIKKICDIVPPDISIVTSINQQHMAIFKSIQHTLHAKFEIIEYAKKDSTAIINADNEYTLKMAEMTNKKKVLYSKAKELNVWAGPVKSEKERLIFTVHAGNQKAQFDVNIIGAYNVENILAATAAALEIGMPLEKIASQFKKARNLGKLSLKEGINNSKIIDDSYNSNPDGFKAALQVLQNTKGKEKILVTSGILELGGKKEEIYEELADFIKDSVDTIVTSDQLLFNKLDDSVKRHLSQTTKDQLSVLREVVNADDVVLIEGANLKLAQELILSVQ